MRPLLPALVPVLLESLSGLEDARLNYVEQVTRSGLFCGGFWAQVLWGFWAQGLLCRAGGVLDKPITEGAGPGGKNCAATGDDQPSQALLTQSTCCLFSNSEPQNAERYGLDSSRLDAVRVAASRSSPAAEALEVAARACDAATAPALVTQLVTLVRRGEEGRTVQV